MAVESPIEARDGWFLGEDKVLQYTVYAEDGKTLEDITAWTFEWKLYRRRDQAEPVVTKASNAGVTVLDGDAGVVGVIVNAEDTLGLGADNYFAVLWRADEGMRQVLAYGGAVLRDVVKA
ncbi:MAG TPA: hypothetical protein VFX80_10475 [Solirubrobacteraceae bacterium]|nr:hypothetical protein [Solirubrobacteraceae bacterium]